MKVGPGPFVQLYGVSRKHKNTAFASLNGGIRFTALLNQVNKPKQQQCAFKQ